ncbi:hypothetical protein ACFQ88_23300 [Paenibacillus sp. NPDC056579]|uniref:hypothetical protein n=1 Tax=Paenibacillus sp. NPDC056579 TaxID=3345871 RepID=UPI0036A45079
MSSFFYSYESFLNDYRYDQLKTYMKRCKIACPEKIDQAITIIEAEEAKRIQSNWKPVAIVGFILFPIVGEYVGFRYNVVIQKNVLELDQQTENFDHEPFNETVEYTKIRRDLVSNWHNSTQDDGLTLLLFDLAPLLISIALFVWVISVMLEKLFLRSSYERSKLIKLLRIMRLNQRKP